MVATVLGPAVVRFTSKTELAWDGRYGSLAELLAAHVRGQLGDDLATAVVRISEVPGYRAHFARVGGAANAAPSGDTALTAFSAFLLTRYAGNAPWDRLERSPSVPADVKAGYQLFAGKAQCSVCHPPPLYTDHQYHRLGLIATPDEGRGRVDTAKQGAFKTPTLREIARSAPYMHDGSLATLEDVIEHYDRGGTPNPQLDEEIFPLKLTTDEKKDLITFLKEGLSSDSYPDDAPPELPE